MKRLFLLFLLAAFTTPLPARNYGNYEQNDNRLKALAAKYPDKARLQSLGKTVTGKDIWVLTLRKDAAEKHPAVAVLAGVDGRRLLGTELALGVAEKLLEHPDADSLLAENTFYIFPNVQPDATEQYFASLCYERSANARETDNDRDGDSHEDPYEDLNGDGLITLMRVDMPGGTHIESPEDPRLLIPADPAKGEIGKYSVLSEGIDNDKDGLFNEDGEGGVNFNRNFTFGYENFGPESGEHAVSEIESRAVADFLYDAFNIHTVLVFGPDNNLSQVVQARETLPAGLGANLEKDSGIHAYVSRLYRQSVPGMADASPTLPSGGEFYTWAYQHYGRYAFSTPGWVALPAKRDSTDTPEQRYLNWADEQGIGDSFVPWRPVGHPGFPEGAVEVGGIKPYLLHNPPHETVPGLVDAHLPFILALTHAAPRIGIVALNKEPLDKGICRITLTLKNNGLMPTISQIGERSYFLKYVTVQLTSSPGQKFLQGNPKVILPVLDGGKTVEFSWLIQGGGKLAVEAGCPTAGYAVTEIVL